MLEIAQFVCRLAVAHYHSMVVWHPERYHHHSEPVSIRARSSELGEPEVRSVDMGLG